MNISSGGAVGVLAIVSSVFSLVMMVFWVVVAWRGVRALEGIDESLRERSGS